MPIAPITQAQSRVLGQLLREPGSKVNKNVLSALERRNMVADGTVLVGGYHALSLFKNCPRIDVPSDELIDKYKGKRVVLDEEFEGEDYMIEIYSFSASGHVETYNLDATRLLKRYVEYASAVNEEMARRWTTSHDREWEYHRKDRALLSSLMIKQATKQVKHQREYFGYYTSSIFEDICRAMMKDTPDGSSVRSSSMKYSFYDTDDEVKPFLCDESLTCAKRLRYTIYK